MDHTVNTNRAYWEQFYKRNGLSVPSQFCAMVATEISPEPCVVELGCGNGRDSLYFASRQHQVCAVDMSHEAVKSCSEAAADMGLDTVQFMQGDLSNSEDLQRLFEAARDMTQAGDVVCYSRFVMHSINQDQEDLFLTNLSAVMKSGEKIYFEFRSKEDADLEKTFGGHYRRFVDTQAFIDAQTKRHGFELLYALTGRGMAKYKSEDPYVSRLIFEKK
ncbi:class I SAM-dependent methyltransferase [Hellea sp.]|nr:class I SAM-dependent methyltransferase [Hellea sp.]